MAKILEYFVESVVAVKQAFIGLSLSVHLVPEVYDSVYPQQYYSAMMTGESDELSLSG